MQISIHTEYIELFALLKLAGLAETGGQGKEMIRAGIVSLDGATATELRKKVRPGSTVQVEGQTIEVVAI
jgi:ribosome-associated protein